jgi:hypothetical protein
MVNRNLMAGSTKRRIAFDARLKTLRGQMRQTKEDLDNMQFMLTLSRHDGYYCQTCSPKRKSGVCSQTCALLRPDSYKGDSTVLSSLESRVKVAFLAQTRNHRVIAAALKRGGDSTNLTEVEQWESTVDEWYWKGENASERWFGHKPLGIEVDFGVVDWNGKSSRDRLRLKRKHAEYVTC